jgi:hypothetical protein
VGSRGRSWIAVTFVLARNSDCIERGREPGERSDPRPVRSLLDGTPLVPATRPHGGCCPAVRSRTRLWSGPGARRLGPAPPASGERAPRRPSRPIPRVHAVARSPGCTRCCSVASTSRPGWIPGERAPGPAPALCRGEARLPGRRVLRWRSSGRDVARGLTSPPDAPPHRALRGRRVRPSPRCVASQLGRVGEPRLRVRVRSSPPGRRALASHATARGARPPGRPAGGRVAGSFDPSRWPLTPSGEPAPQGEPTPSMRRAGHPDRAGTLHPRSAAHSGARSEALARFQARDEKRAG